MHTMTTQAHLFLVAAIAGLAFAAGYAVSRRRGRELPVRPATAWWAGILGVALWLGVSMSARMYAETDWPGWIPAEWYAHRGRWLLFYAVTLTLSGVAYPLGPHGRRPRSRLVLLTWTAILTFITIWRTVPIYPFLSKHSLRDDKGHIRQSVEYTCGPVCLANYLAQFHGLSEPSEREMALLSGTTVEGNTWHGLMRAARHMQVENPTCTILTVEQLKRAGGPAIVSISTLPSVRHATLLTGFHGDTVRFIDPALGYRELPIKRFLEIWYGKTLLLGR